MMYIFCLVFVLFWIGCPGPDYTYLAILILPRLDWPPPWACLDSSQNWIRLATLLQAVFPLSWQCQSDTRQLTHTDSFHSFNAKIIFCLQFFCEKSDRVRRPTLSNTSHMKKFQDVKVCVCKTFYSAWQGPCISQIMSPLSTISAKNRLQSCQRIKPLMTFWQIAINWGIIFSWRENECNYFIVPGKLHLFQMTLLSTTWEPTIFT